MPESDPKPADVADAPTGFESLHVGGALLPAARPGVLHGRCRRRHGGARCAWQNAISTSSGITHGGMLATVADGALGINIAIARERRQRAGDGVVDRRLPVRWATRRLARGARQRSRAWASAWPTRAATSRSATRHVLRSSGVFAFVDRPWPRRWQQRTAAAARRLTRGRASVARRPMNDPRANNRRARRDPPRAAPARAAEPGPDGGHHQRPVARGDAAVRGVVRRAGLAGGHRRRPGLPRRAADGAADGRLDRSPRQPHDVSARRDGRVRCCTCCCRSSMRRGR